MSKQRKPKILLVDDEEEIQSIISLLLEKNYEIQTADNGRDAFEIINRDPPPDLIVTDIVMPQASGLDLIASIKEKKIPIIAMSGRGTEYLETAKIMGAVAVVGKPFHIADLHKTIDNILAQKK